jgi:Restriction endonuclease
MSPYQKGNALEAAVAAIEELILQSSPAHREKTWFIENKKLIQVDGVHHEIDIYVTIDLGEGYKSVFIFECKNWQEAVGKNEIIIFSKKIEVSSAQSGYFIAKSFTADAMAQGKTDPRITLKIAKEHEPAGTILPFGFHTTSNQITCNNVKFRIRGNTGAKAEALDIASSVMSLDGVPLDWEPYFLSWSIETVNQDMLNFPSGQLPDGVYDRSAQSARTFRPAQLIVNGKYIESISLTVKFQVHLKRPVVISHYEIESRGRVISFRAPYGRRHHL